MRIIAFGDIHMNPERIGTIPALAQADLVIVTGDLTNFGTWAEADKVLGRLTTINPRLLALAGNLDYPQVETGLAAAGLSLHGRGVIRQKIGLFGAGGSNITPFATPNEFSEEELAALLNTGYQMVANAERHVLVSHTPPLNTITDLIASGIHVGSLAVRNFIEKEQPDLCLCGHIHEGRGIDTIGRTTVINPGMLQDGGWIEITATADAITSSLHP
ncbi:MAG: metallophosphoesterase family protein [Desulfobulbaceae bacterium]|nr:metallophosphoesterase family protein [Desulfobulbaceae bacterium]HIJ79455.1 serine/threonine protein phosphatase [Deltaproteobacteria bacterium]